MRWTARLGVHERHGDGRVGREAEDLGAGVRREHRGAAAAGGHGEHVRGARAVQLRVRPPASSHSVSATWLRNSWM